MKGKGTMILWHISVKSSTLWFKVFIPYSRTILIINISSVIITEYTRFRIS